MGKPINVETIKKIKLMLSRKKPPTPVDGALADRQRQKSRADSLQKQNDSLRKVVMELQMKLGEAKR